MATTAIAKFNNKPTRLLSKKEWNPDNYNFDYKDNSIRNADAVSEMISLTRPEDLTSMGMRLTKIYDLNPNMDPNVALALVKSNSSTQAIALAGNAAYNLGRTAGVVKPPASPDANDSEFYKDLKAVSRYGFSFLMAPWELVGNAMRFQMVAGINAAKAILPDAADQMIDDNLDKVGWKIGNRGLDLASIYEGTELHQLLWNDSLDNGTGFFVSPEVMQASEKIAEEQLSVYGKGWTLGRGLASNLYLDPESSAYTAVSGTVDFFAALMLDPTIVGGKLAAAAKAARGIKAFGEAAQVTRNAVVAEQLALRAEEMLTLQEASAAAQRATGSARMSLDEASSVLNRQYADYQKMMLDADKYYKEGALLGRTDDEIEALRQSTNMDGLLAERAALLEQSAAVKNGDVVKTVTAALTDEGRQWLRAEARRTKQSVKTVLQRTGMQTLRDSGFLDNSAESITQAAARLTREALVRNTEDLYNAALKTYGNKIDDVYFPGAKAAVEADLTIARRAVEQRQLALQGWVNRARNPQEQLAFIERMRAGLLDRASDMKIDTKKATEWFAQGKADPVFEAIAKLDSAATIQRLSGGKFGIELSHALSKAATVDEVEKIILNQIGAQVNQTLSRGQIGRITQAAGIKDIGSMGIREGISVYTGRKLESLFGKFATTDLYIPARTFIDYNNLNELALNAERWLKMARVPQEMRNATVNRIAALSEETNAFVRASMAHKIMTEMLTEAAVHNIDASSRASKVIRDGINKASKAYESEITGLRTYAAEGNAKGRYSFDFDVEGVTISLDEAILSPTDMARGITLPNIREFRQATGRIRAALSRFDEKVLGGNDIGRKAYSALEKTAFVVFDDFLRTSLLVFRGAFILRNLGEMMVRQALSPRSVSPAENALLYAAMVVSDPNTANRFIQAAARKIGKYDPLTLDVNGVPFYDATVTARSGMPQDFVNSYANSISSRFSSIDGRVYKQHTGVFSRINYTGTNTKEFAEAWAGELMKFHADPVKRAMASGELPTLWAGAVARGEMSYEQGFVRAFMAGDIPGMPKETVEAFLNADKRLHNLLTSGEESRIKFFFGKDKQFSYANEMDRATLGIDSLREFIATGKIEDAFNSVAMSADFNINAKNVRSAVAKYLDDEEIARRAQHGQMLYSMPTVVGNAKKAVESFFEISARLERRVVYGPEYRVAYWNAVSELAPFMDSAAAQRILANTAESLGKAKIVVKGKEVPFSKFAKDKMDILERAKSNTGGFSFKDVDAYANRMATKQVATLFYDAAKQNRLAYAMRLIMPFAQAWGNTLKKWGRLSATTYGVARVNSAARVLQALESEDSGKIYDIFGMGSTDGEGFIFDNEYGEKVFRVPFSGNLISMFSSADGVDIKSPISSFNLAFSGGQVPGMDAGVLPGFGPMVQFGLNYALTDSQYNALPEYIRMAIQPYGRPADSPYTAALPSWIQKGLAALDANSSQKMAVAQQLANYKISSDPKYMQLMTGKLSIGERKALQQQLIEETNSEATSLLLTQALMQNVMPSTPILNFFAETKQGSFSQVQLSNSFYNMYQDNGGDYNAALAQFADTYGNRAITVMIRGYSSSLMTTSEAWDFAQSHPDLSDKYMDIMPYFFPRDGIFSQTYAKALRTRRGATRMTLQEILAEADSMTANLIKDRLIRKAAENGYDDTWIAEQYKNLVGDQFGAGWNPTVRSNTAVRENRLATIREAIKSDKMISTPLGGAIKTYIDARDAYLADSDYKTLGAQGNADIRLELENLANDLIQNNPDFRWVFNSLFASELRG